MGENRFQPLDGLTEEQMLAEEAKVYEKYDPIESAAQMFYMYSPQFLNLVKRMPRKALERLVDALVQGVLAEKPFKPTTKQEGAAFVIGDKLLQARWVMQLHSLSQVAQEVQAAKEPEVSQSAPPGSILLSEALPKVEKFDTIGTTDLIKGDE